MKLVFDLGVFGDVVCSKSIIMSCKSIITSRHVEEFGSSTSLVVTLLTDTSLSIFLLQANGDSYDCHLHHLHSLAIFILRLIHLLGALFKI
jgi:hypothetical protein